MGFDYIALASGYEIIRGTKSQFNAAIDTLYDNVLPQFRPQILLPAPLVKEKFETTASSNFVTTEPFKGARTYIGIIGVDGIDYTNPLLLDKDNQTRIAYVWEQTIGNTGNTYTRQDIQQAIDNQKDLSIMPSDNAYLSTTLLGIAGGSEGVNKQYAGVASQAEFVVAKINKAPDKVQDIYVGKADPNGVLLEDILIGLNQLLAFANKNKEPIIICLPYGSNISSHDGQKILESRINALALQPGVSILTMTGEEANKKHHGSLEINSGTQSQLNIVVAQENQKIVGAIWINPVYELYVNLYNPSKDKAYDLTRRATYTKKKERLCLMENG